MPNARSSTPPDRAPARGTRRRPTTRPLRRTPARCAAAVLCALALTVASAAPAAGVAAPGAAQQDRDDTPFGGYDAGCAPDPETGQTYCGERDASAPEAPALRAQPPVATTLAGVRAGSGPALEAVGSAFGLSDQNDPALVDAWRDPRANSPRGLNLHEGRLVIPWNVYTRAKAATPGRPASTATRVGRDLDRWCRALQEMKQGGFDAPLVSFGRQRDFGTNGRSAPQPLPSPAEYIDAVASFLDYVTRLEDADPSDDRYPDLRRFTAWNEPNNATQPTAGVTNARRAGQYFRKLAAFCAGRCSVAAGDFAEQSATPADRAAFMAYFGEYCDGMDGRADHRCGYRPLYWAFHPYSCGFRRQTAGVLDFVRATAADPGGAPSPEDPDIWFTEAGGVVTQHYNRDPDGHTVSRRTLMARADGDLGFLLTDCLAVSPRITRFYVYHWAGDRNVDPATHEDRGFEADLTDVAAPISGDPVNRFRTTPLYCTFKAAVNPGPCAPPG